MGKWVCLPFRMLPQLHSWRTKNKMIVGLLTFSFSPVTFMAVGSYFSKTFAIRFLFIMQRSIVDFPIVVCWKKRIKALRKKTRVETIIKDFKYPKWRYSPMSAYVRETSPKEPCKVLGTCIFGTWDFWWNNPTYLPTCSGDWFILFGNFSDNVLDQWTLGSWLYFQAVAVFKLVSSTNCGINQLVKKEDQFKISRNGRERYRKFLGVVVVRGVNLIDKL